MIGINDRSQMQSDLNEVRGDREESVALRRGANTLAEQSVRIARVRQGLRSSSGQGGERRADVILLGDVTFDAQVDDRFTSAGVLYRVSFIRPNTDAAVIAEAVAVQ
jgi:hypothetical protein